MDDSDQMFRVGFLADVYNENPSENVITRFPPEPNGYLHIGHSKAITVNFGFARHRNGETYLRFDDTNPGGEKEEYFKAIEDMISWLGFQPVKITYSSDNFERLYELAEELIKRDGAYVCHCTSEEVHEQRGAGKNRPRVACPHRNRPIGESLFEFRAMRDGKYKAGEATLRMKQNLEDGNPQMWDLYAYRIKEGKDALHYRTGDKWRIYPTYDFTHCLCDSLEGITHSLCTTEFELARVSYEWLCDKLELYKPMQREYGRLNVEGTVLSKRKIQFLVERGYVESWDDPRLYSLIALRRRGVPPGAILSFVRELGVTKATTNIQVARLEQSIRRYLEVTVPRLMLILDPVEVVIDNLPEDHLEMVEVPFSKDPSFGARSLPFTKIVYIDQSDFREADSKDYFRLALGKTVGLMKVPHPITATSIEKDEATGLITRVHARYELPEAGAARKKPKTYIQWVSKCLSQKSPINLEVRAFNSLFSVSNPTTVKTNDLPRIINPKSREVFPKAMVEIGFSEIRQRSPWPGVAGGLAMANSDVEARPETVRFQGMRVAYFAMDKDSTEENIVLNRIVSLKEDAGK